MQGLTIGKLAEITGISADTLRYYEKMKLIRADRTDGGYRVYDADAEGVIRFILGAKALNFTLEEIRSLLSLESSDQTSCVEVLKKTEAKIAEAEFKIKELKEVQKVLKRLTKICPGDDTPTNCCPILDHIKGTAKTVLMLVTTLTLAGVPQAQAKPISYVGGTMVMQENDETGHTLSMDYTVTPNYAIGLYAKRELNERSGKDFTTAGPQINTLIKRWNMPNGQGNIFNMTGVGISHAGSENKFSAWTGFLADYETRRIFVSYEPRFMYAGDLSKSFWERARVGAAPYLGSYDGLNTWLMLQVDHHPSKDDTFVVTPLVRFFYKTTLVEAGYSSNDHVMFNWQMQF